MKVLILMVMMMKIIFKPYYSKILDLFVVQFNTINDDGVVKYFDRCFSTIEEATSFFDYCIVHDDFIEAHRVSISC